MMRRVLRFFREAVWHPSDEQLVAFNDVELTGREASRVRRHLGHCWRCRTRQRELEDTVGAFMTACADALDEDEPLPFLPQLPRRALDALGGAPPRRLAGAVPLPARLRAWLLPAAPTAGISPVIVRLGAVCATAVLVVLLSAGAPLSARQLVRHVDRAEQVVLQAAEAPVVYQRLEVATRRLPAGPTAAGIWEVWTDVGLGRHTSRRDDAAGSARGRADASVQARSGSAHRPNDTAPGLPETTDALAALFEVFDRQRMNEGWPISLRSHQRWREGDPAARDSVSKTRTDAGEPAVALESTASVGRDDSGVVRAALVVRERDWHPVEQRLVVRQGETTTEFVVREAGFRVLPLASLPVAFFDADTAPAAPPTTTTAAAGVALADADLRRPLRPAAGALIAAEVEAMYALHRFGTTAEDELAVNRHDDEIEVVGLTTTMDRKRGLVDALAGIPLVRTRIRTADEALAALSAETKPSASMGV